MLAANYWFCQEDVGIHINKNMNFTAITKYYVIH